MALDNLVASRTLLHMDHASNDSDRVDFKSEGGMGLALLLVVLMGAVGLIAMRVIFAAIELGDFWTLGILACIVLALLVWGIVSVLISMWAPYLIVTAQDIRQPKTFKTIRHIIGPETRVGRYTIDAVGYTQETTTAARRTVVRTRYVLKNGAGPLVHLASATPDHPQLDALARAIEDVAGIKVEVLDVTPRNVALGTPAGPDVSHWK